MYYNVLVNEVTKGQENVVLTHKQLIYGYERFNCFPILIKVFLILLQHVDCMNQNLRV